MPLPIVVLGGSDQRPGPVPATMQAADMLTGFKGALEIAGGRTLIGELVERIRESGCFEEPLVLGPRQVYEGKVDCEIVDVEGTLPVTLERLRRLVAERFDPDAPLALIAYDVLPSPDEFRAILHEAYEPHRDAFLWWQLIDAAPEVMGASAWKAAYHLRTPEHHEGRALYPGHLVVARPSALRFRLLNQLLGSAYRHRNELIHRRVLPMILDATAALVSEDVRGLLGGRLPLLTLTMPFRALGCYRRFRQGRMHLNEFEAEFARLVVHRAFRRRSERPVAISISSIASLAKDVDSVAELEEARRASCERS